MSKKLTLPALALIAALALTGCSSTEEPDVTPPDETSEAEQTIDTGFPEYDANLTTFAELAEYQDRLNWEPLEGHEWTLEVIESDQAVQYFLHKTPEEGDSGTARAFREANPSEYETGDAETEGDKPSDGPSYQDGWSVDENTTLAVRVEPADSENPETAVTLILHKSNTEN